MSALGYNTVVIGIAFLAMTLVGVFTLLVYGVLGDRRGYKKVLMLTEALFALSTLALANTASLPVIIIAASLGGYGGQGGGGLRGGFGPGSTALVGSLYSEQEERLKRVGRLTFVGGILSIVGNALLGAHAPLEERVGTIEAFRLLYYVAFIASVLSLATLSFIKEPPRPSRRASVLTSKSARFVTKVSIANFVNGFGIGLAIPLLPLWFKVAFGLNPSQISVIYTASSITSAISSFNAHRFSSERTQITVGALTRVFNGALLASMIIPGNAVVAAALYAARSASAGIGAPTRSAVTLGGVGSDEFGVATSLTAIANRLAFGSSSIGGYLLSVTDSLPLEFGGLLQFAAGALYYFLLKERDEQK
jgi:hypothetical protein